MHRTVRLEARVLWNLGPPRLAEVLDSRSRIARRVWLSAVLEDRDFQRDLEAAALRSQTVRLSYGQVFDRPCTTAGLVATFLGRPATRCGPDCLVPR